MDNKFFSVVDLLALNSTEERLKIVAHYVSEGLIEEVSEFWGIQYRIQLYPILKKLGINDEIRKLMKEHSSVTKLQAATDESILEKPILEQESNSDNFPNDKSLDQNTDVIDKNENLENNSSNGIINNEEPLTKRRGRKKGSKNKITIKPLQEIKDEVMLEEPILEQSKSEQSKSEQSKLVETMRFQLQGNYHSLELTERLKRIIAFLEISNCYITTDVLIEVS
jgi:hypothetical protein